MNKDLALSDALNADEDLCVELLINDIFKSKEFRFINPDSSLAELLKEKLHIAYKEGCKVGHVWPSK